MEMGLLAGNIEEMSTYRCVSNYITGQNAEYVQVSVSFKLSGSFCCAFREEDADYSFEQRNSRRALLGEKT